MSSCTLVQNFIPHQPYNTHDYETYLPTPQSSVATEFEYSLYDPNFIEQALSVLQQQQYQQQQQQHTSTNHCMGEDYRQLATAQPDIRLQSSTPTPLPQAAYDDRQDSVTSAAAPGYDWQQMYQTSMGGPISATQRGLKRGRSHQRTPSASTIASNGPASPYTATFSYPQIANTDYSPNSPAQYAEQVYYPKNLPTPQQTPTDSVFASGNGYIPSQAAHTPTAHLAMKGFAIDHHTDEFTPDYYHSSHPSMSSHGNSSPATPLSGAGEQIADVKQFNMGQNGLDYRQPNSNVSLFRTESSQAYQDELYNPQAYTATPTSAAQRHPDYLTPHRNLISERLQTAHLARTGSPTSAISRERSPFRDGSPLAPSSDWHQAGHHMGTAASLRQQRQQEAAQAEYEAHVPQLNRKSTETISPKDALLDYNETDQPPLFQDAIPAGYRQHTGGTESWQNNFAGSSFGNLTATGPSQQQQMAPFRATSADHDYSGQFSFVPLPPTSGQDQAQIQGTQYPGQSYAAADMDYSEPTPRFPAQLTSMESSLSENGPPVSSQESYNTSAPQTAPQRPADTRAATGTYTCTYHGCTQRFDSHQNLQKHKRDFHRSQQQTMQQQQHRDTPSTGTGTGTESASPRSTESPAPSASGMTSAALLARNSQAGPHKCTRINPSTNKPCNTIFSRPYDLTRHEDTIHNNRKQKVRCPMCREEKTFSRNDALTRHMRVVHPEVEQYGKRGRRD